MPQPDLRNLQEIAHPDSTVRRVRPRRILSAATLHNIVLQELVHLLSARLDSTRTKTIREYAKNVQRDRTATRVLSTLAHQASIALNINHSLIFHSFAICDFD